VFLALFFERLSLPLFGCKCRGHVAFNGASHKFVRLHDWRIVSCLLYLRPMSRMLVRIECTCVYEICETKIYHYHHFSRQP
jgi:hypothetical protein